MTTPNPHYTPGPWEVSHTGKAVIKVLNERKVQPICTVTNEANARLIAAAPELLEALEYICFNQGKCECHRGYACSYCKAKKAIVKAKGESK